MSTTTCPPLPDYLTLRKENLAKIQTYYSKLLGEYDALKGNNMSSAKNLISSYNTQLNSAAEGLVDNLNKTLDLITEQHKNLEENQNLVVANRQRLTQLKKDIKNLTVENDARRKNVADTHDSTKNTEYWHIGFLIGNIILLLLAVGILIWLFMKPDANY
jgi:septal ring factor EnvC (AmiA/AmiB activator)